MWRWKMEPSDRIRRWSKEGMIVDNLLFIYINWWCFAFFFFDEAEFVAGNAYFLYSPFFFVNFFFREIREISLLGIPLKGSSIINGHPLEFKSLLKNVTLNQILISLFHSHIERNRKSDFAENSQWISRKELSVNFSWETE